MDEILENKHRLDRSEYQGQIASAFTLCIQNSTPLFISDKVFNIFEERFLKALSKNNCRAHVYLFMPDHCHLLIQGKDHKSDLWRAIVDFKQSTGFWLAKNELLIKWQKDFYDHVLRNDEDIEKQVKYILDNPRRKGLADEWNQYPYKGSTMYDFVDFEP
ncbi:MAG: transposase [Patescibacteria group bacterium]|nr:transposase [Patescibacteria group bacterium]